ncbi:hypothetical protein GH714_041625 [Hevea brasiliensis]|uniref:SWIM-type domain-containing protein n=1 Tax=Hevea brasiliensis TaxID=3981 RepID=A0A6A6MSU5_HEVBR|nr:hypothetical protein GH714_041625 [Hevea brasiliensis]
MGDNMLKELDSDDLSHTPVGSDDDYITQKGNKKRRDYVYDPSCDHSSIVFEGFINAISRLGPYAEHKNCARHIWANCKKVHRGEKYRKLFWNASYCTYEANYKNKLNDMKDESQAAYDDFLVREPRLFCKAFIGTRTKSNIMENNIWLRSSKFMTKECSLKPAISDTFDASIKDDKFVMDLVKKTCNCGEWDLNGIPCHHACACINYMRQSPVNYVNEFYYKSTYMATYQNALRPLNGLKMWPEVKGWPIQPQPFKKMLGRPKKYRKNDVAEAKDRKHQVAKDRCENEMHKM